MSSFLLISDIARALIISIYYLLILSYIFLLIILVTHRPSKLKMTTTILLLAAVSANAIWLTGLQNNGGIGLSSVGIIKSLGNMPWLSHLFLAFLLSFYFAMNMWQENKKIRSQITPTSIAEGFEKLPIGLAFSTIDGLPLLTNQKIYDLAFDVTGKPFRNTVKLWEDFEDLNCNSAIIEDKNILTLVVQDSKENYWQLSKDMHSISNRTYIQITAVDVTEPYKLSSELMSRNKDLKARSEMLKILADELVDIHREEEILASKIRIHNELGKCILAGDHYISQACKGDMGQLVKLWEEVIERLLASADIPSQNREEILHEIQESASLLGCEVVIDGCLPTNEDTAYILLTALREGVTNAVRHSGATRVNFSIREEENRLKVLISDNGKKIPTSIIEGEGLSSLRKRIIKGGGMMDVSCDKGVTISFTLPLSEKEEAIWKRQES